MGKQVWGTFSVKDHCDPNAFIAEVMLYDRLVIPVPPDDKDRKRWDDAGWQPERLDKLLEILGERAYPVFWDDNRRRSWKTRYEAGADIAQGAAEWAFSATRTELTEGLPRNVTGIQTVANYTSLQDIKTELGLKAAEGGELPLYGGTAVAILGHEFLIPGDPRWTYEDLLKEAVALSSERASRRKRTAFWRWQREFFDDKGITDQSALKDAVEEMQYLLNEEKKLIRKNWKKTSTQFCFLVGSLTLGMLGGPLTAVGIGGAFVSVGQFMADKLFEKPVEPSNKPVSLLRDIRKHFGWR